MIISSKLQKTKNFLSELFSNEVKRKKADHWLFRMNFIANLLELVKTEYKKVEFNNPNRHYCYDVDKSLKIKVWSDIFKELLEKTFDCSVEKVEEGSLSMANSTALQIRSKKDENPKETVLKIMTGLNSASIKEHLQNR